MIVLVSIVAQVAMAAPTLAEILALSPQAAGERALQGRDHNVIEAVAPVRDTRMRPPHTVEVDLVERPTKNPQHCARHSWRTTFRFQSGETEQAARLVDSYPRREIVLANSEACPLDGYVRIEASVDDAEALTALTALEQIRSGQGGLELSCRDDTSSGLCEDDRSIQGELTRHRAFAVVKRNDVVLIWLGNDGSTVTEVRLDPGAPDKADIHRRVPHPI